jgi:hypothetical protein
MKARVHELEKGLIRKLGSLFLGRFVTTSFVSFSSSESEVLLMFVTLKTVWLSGEEPGEQMTSSMPLTCSMFSAVAHEQCAKWLARRSDHAAQHPPRLAPAEDLVTFDGNKLDRVGHDG